MIRRWSCPRPGMIEVMLLLFLHRLSCLHPLPKSSSSLNLSLFQGAFSAGVFHVCTYMCMYYVGKYTSSYSHKQSRSGASTSACRFCWSPGCVRFLVPHQGISLIGQISLADISCTGMALQGLTGVAKISIPIPIWVIGGTLHFAHSTISYHLISTSCRLTLNDETSASLTYPTKRGSASLSGMFKFDENPLDVVLITLYVRGRYFIGGVSFLSLTGSASNGGYVL